MGGGGLYHLFNSSPEVKRHGSHPMNNSLSFTAHILIVNNLFLLSQAATRPMRLYFWKSNSLLIHLIYPSPTATLFHTARFSIPQGWPQKRGTTIVKLLAPTMFFFETACCKSHTTFSKRLQPVLITHNLFRRHKPCIYSLHRVLIAQGPF